MDPHPTNTRPRGTIVGLSLITTLGAFAQGQGAAPPFAGDERDMVDTVYVPPGLVYDASYYCWCDFGCPATGDWVQSPPVPWVTSLTMPLGQTATSCSEVYVLRYSVQVPVAPGVYEAQFVDQSGFWATWTLRLKVEDVPDLVDQVISDTLLIDVAYPFPYPADGISGVADIGCTIMPFYPAMDLIYEYDIQPQVPWLGVVPDSLEVPAGTMGYPVFTAQSAVQGLFTTYVYDVGTWYSWPYITRVDVLFVQPTSVADPAPPSPGLFPVPAYDQLGIDLPDADMYQFTVMDARGGTVAGARGSGPRHRLDVRALPPGPYLLRCASAKHVLSRGFVKD